MTSGSFGPASAALKVQQLNLSLIEVLKQQTGSDGSRVFLKVYLKEDALTITINASEESCFAEVARLIHRTIRSALKENVDRSLVDGLREHFREWKKGQQQQVKFQEIVEVTFIEDQNRRESAALIDERNYGTKSGKSVTFHMKERERLLLQGAPKFGEMGEIIDSRMLGQAFDLLFGLHYGKTSHSLDRGELLDSQAKRLVSEVISETLTLLKKECEAQEKSPDEALKLFESKLAERINARNNKKMVLRSDDFKLSFGGLLRSFSTSAASEVDPATGNFGTLVRLIKEGSWREVVFSTMDFKRETRAKEVISKIINHPLVQNDLRLFLSKAC